MVSGLPGRNLGGRALSVKFEFESRAKSTIIEPHYGKEKPSSLTESGPSLVWMVGAPLLEFLATASTRRIFPRRQPASIPYVSSSFLLSRAWHSQGWELMRKDPACPVFAVPAADPCLGFELKVI